MGLKAASVCTSMSCTLAPAVVDVKTKLLPVLLTSALKPSKFPTNTPVAGDVGVFGSADSPANSAATSAAVISAAAMKVKPATVTDSPVNKS